MKSIPRSRILLILAAACGNLGSLLLARGVTREKEISIRAAVGAGLGCIGVASHESPESLAAAGAIHVVRDFESVSAHDLERMLLGGNLASRQAGAGLS